MAIIHITTENFDKEVMQSDKSVLLDFYADWCGPCRMVAPTLEEIAGEREDITIGKINVDTDPELAIRFQVSSIPLLVVMDKGQIVSKALGARPKQSILDMLP